jgi:hypothetical protein
MTSPMWSTSRLTSAPATLRDHIDALALVFARGAIFRRRRMSIVETIFPRRLISPRTTAWRQGHMCDLLLADHFLDLQNGNAEEVLTQIKGAKLHKFHATSSLCRHACQLFDIEQIRDPLLDNRAPQNSALSFADFDLDTFLDNVLNRVHDHAQIIRLERAHDQR